MSSNSAPKRAGRLKRWLLRLVALAIAFLLALVVMEWALKAFDLFGVNHGERQQKYRAEALTLTHLTPTGEDDLDGTLFVHKPNVDVDLGAFRVRTNRFGFRGPDFDVPKPKGVHRTLILGDSVSFGWGVDDEVTFLRRFEQALNARAQAQQRFEIVNTGIPLYDTVQELAILERVGFLAEPDLVVLIYVVNDIDPTRDLMEVLLERREPEAPLPPTGLDRVANTIDGWFPAIAQVVRVWSNKGRDWQAIIDANGGDYIPEEYGKGPRGWQRSQDALRKIRDLCRQRGVPFVLLDHSFPSVRALPGFCEDEGIVYRELRFTEEEAEGPIYNSAIDPHSNEAGHTLLLEKLERVWSDLKLPGAK